ncbi:MAG TPA: NADH-quinone oxidoreductase subunit L [Euzebyales bacterium]|nr:NADH-quinone oxidoreductase subunit L [Euzebyales bacterium]
MLLPTPLLAAAEGGFTGHYVDAVPGSPVDLAWLIPVVPAVSATLLLLFGRRFGRPAAWFAIAAVGYGAVASTMVFIHLLGQPEDGRSIVTTVAPWIAAGDLQVDWALLIDPLSSVMLLLVTWVGLLIHIYSLGYMEGDERFTQFFAYLNLFIASMLVLVLGESMLVLFVGWELVGLCSYLLIGFWFSERANATAAKKAFVVNRIGDVGFMIAMFLTFSAVGSLSFTEVLPRAGEFAAGTAVAVGVLLLIGATGKSAQIPLFVWLPDAMAGPTPVSALIHAATMVTAGVYLVARMSPLYAAIHDAGLFDVGLVVAWIGVLTALLAALIACAQNDLTRILAYSTISQLGYMFVGVGLGSQAAGVFHLLTHGFFKALLFLAAGSVMHAMHEETDVWKMGGLRRFMPITFATSAVAWLAIAGVPLFSGYYSKEEILLAALDTPGAGLIWVLGAVVAGLTAFYMSRWFFLIFLGESRVPEGTHPHESPPAMTLPLVVLAVASVGGAFIGVTPGSYLRFWAPEHGWLFEWLAPAVQPYVGEQALFNGVLAGLLVTALSLAGIAAAYLLYLRPVDIVAVRARLGWFYQAMLRKFYVDEIYERTVMVPGHLMADGLAAFDARGIDGAVNGIGRGTQALAQVGRRVQTGFVRSYALAVLVGTLLISALFLGGTLLGQ